MTGNPFAEEEVAVESELQPAAHGGFVPSRAACTAAGDPFLTEVHTAFRDFVLRQEFPCLGARAAFNSGSYVLAVYNELASDSSTAELCRDLYEFTQSEIRRASEYATFVAVFAPEGHASACPGRAEARPSEGVAYKESQFETAMWQQLQKLNRADAAHFDWDPGVRSDPTDPHFSFSFSGQALYVIGMHPKSSREARRFKWPAMVFNPHEQFEQLRADGKWKRMQETIRERDVELQGTINPMLSDFGEETEARQYSGREVEKNWRAPFVRAQRKCPFGH